MKSICIKTNNKTVIDYLLENFENLNMKETYISIKDFKHFSNIIIHYKDINTTTFINSISNILTKSTILFYEDNLITDSIYLNYFYFNKTEIKSIIENTQKLLKEYDVINTKYDLINNSIFKHLLNHHSLYFKSFIDFRLKEYKDLIDKKIDLAVNQFLIDKEYIEFVNILRLYINSESSSSNLEHLHLIYKNKDSIIIDDNKNIVSCNDNITKAKYISDITFSSNDLALNTLLNLLPHKITIHLVDGFQDEFIETLKLIFQDKITICEDCDICNMYRYTKIKL